MKNVIKKTPKERCAYLLKITKHYLRESDYLHVKEYANRGKKMAVRYNLEGYEKDFEELIKAAEGKVNL